MRPKAREMTQHGGPSGWLEESDPSGWDLRCDGRSMSPSLTDHIACPGLELLSCELLANPAAFADVLVLNIHTQHRHELYNPRKAWVKTLVRPLPPLWVLLLPLPPLSTAGFWDDLAVNSPARLFPSWWLDWRELSDCRANLQGWSGTKLSMVPPESVGTVIRCSSC